MVPWLIVWIHIRTMATRNASISVVERSTLRRTSDNGVLAIVSSWTTSSSSLPRTTAYSQSNASTYVRAADSHLFTFKTSGTTFRPRLATRCKTVLSANIVNANQRVWSRSFTWARIWMRCGSCSENMARCRVGTKHAFWIPGGTNLTRRTASIPYNAIQRMIASRLLSTPVTPISVYYTRTVNPGLDLIWNQHPNTSVSCRTSISA